jgi:hypothetical protein
MIIITQVSTTSKGVEHENTLKVWSLSADSGESRSAQNTKPIGISCSVPVRAEGARRVNRGFEHKIPLTQVVSVLASEWVSSSSFEYIQNRMNQ